MNIISDKRVHTTLNRLHDEANSEGFAILKGLSKGVFRPLRPEDMKDALSLIHISLSPVVR